MSKVQPFIIVPAWTPEGKQAAGVKSLGGAGLGGYKWTVLHLGCIYKTVWKKQHLFVKLSKMKGG